LALNVEKVLIGNLERSAPCAFKVIASIHCIYNANYYSRDENSFFVEAVQEIQISLCIWSGQVSAGE